MLLLEPPRFAAVLRSLAAPNERIGPDVVERPTQQGPLVVVAAKHDAIVLGSPLHPDGDPEGRGRKHDGPLVSLGIHEPHPGDHLPLVGRAGLRVTEKNVLERVAVQDPSEQHLPARVANAAVLRDERVVGVPRAHKAPEQVRMVPQRRVRSLSRKSARSRAGKLSAISPAAWASAMHAAKGSRHSTKILERCVLNGLLSAETSRLRFPMRHPSAHFSALSFPVMTSKYRRIRPRG